MATQPPYPLANVNDADNGLWRRVLYAIQNPASGGSSVGHFDGSGNVQLVDPNAGTYGSLTAPNGILTVGTH